MLLEAHRVTKRFGGLVAVEDLDFHIREGEILGLIGPNGAGKTTLFNLLTGVYEVSEGRITFQGKDITRCPVHQIARMGMSRTFQNIKLFDSLSVEDNVKIALYNKSKISMFNSIFKTARFRKEMARIHETAYELLSMVGLEGKGKHLANSLAYGEQRYLEIVRALATNPKLLILDEPGAGMNDSESAHLVEHIRNIRAAGHTVLLIEHDMAVIMEVCDRIYVINFGKKIAEGTPQEIRADPKVIAAYLGEEEDDGAA
ncbi:ABC transporter ATP-binding protein [Brevibacillus sp. B_LB10_24]|uniref:ABC transporter ATP-binding protein n=1 Tax=Brevibacillus sp. B_LB10_24 TaxID=3380645 RepID=UPI0038BB7CDE